MLPGMTSPLDWLRRFLAVPETPPRRPLQVGQYGLGVCPRCRGLRSVASERCSFCGSVAPVTEDA